MKKIFTLAAALFVMGSVSFAQDAAKQKPAAKPQQQPAKKTNAASSSNAQQQSNPNPNTGTNSQNTSTNAAQPNHFVPNSHLPQATPNKTTTTTTTK